MNFSKNIVVGCLLSIAFAVSACGGLTRSDKPAISTWWLKPYTGTLQMAYPKAVLSVAVTVTVVPGLDTDQILTLSDNAELNHISGARWADNLPELLTSLVARTLQAAGRFKIVSDYDGKAEEDCNLELELRQFFTTLNPAGQTSEVNIAINGQYQCGSAEPIVVTSSASVPVDNVRINVIVAAFQKATDMVMEDILSQL